MSKKSLFAIFIFALFCTGCENTLPLPDEYMRPLLVMNGLFTPDSLLEVQLTHSRGINEVPESTLPPGSYGSPVNPGKYPPVEDAEVRLYVDDVLRETLPHVGNGVYRSASFRPAEGQRIRVEAENAALGSVSGETALPRTVPIDSVTFGNMSLAYSYNIQTECSADGCVDDTVGYSIDYEYDLRIRFTDPAGERNYYCLQVEREEYEDYWVKEHFDLAPVFDPGSEALDEFVDVGNADYYYNQFDDELFDGKAFTIALPMYLSGNYVDLTADTPGIPSEPPVRRLRITLQSISRDYYLYLKTMGQLVGSSLLNDLFAEPVQVYNNIEGGIGIVGGCRASTAEVTVEAAGRCAMRTACRLPGHNGFLK